jgi:hypothetical protein
MFAQFCPAFCHFISRMAKFSFQHLSVLKHLLSVLVQATNTIDLSQLSGSPA